MSDIFRKAYELLKEGETLAVSTIVRVEGSTPRGIGAKMIVTRDGRTYGSIGGGRVEDMVLNESLEVLRKGESKVVNYVLEDITEGGIGMPCGGEVEISIEYVQPKPTLLIIGSGHVAKSLARLGSKIDALVVVLDPQAKRENFSDADQIISDSVEKGLSKVKITPQTYVVVVTRHEQDEQALRGVIDSEARYIGLIGSKKRADIVFQTLKTAGVDEEKIKSIYSPIGLDIGAETPEEIAVSIIAELIMVRRGGTGGSLSSKR